jgi:aspartate aminotransferase-like enzyme
MKKNKIQTSVGANANILEMQNCALNKYPLSLVPGPVCPTAATLATYGQWFGSPDLHHGFLVLYQATEKLWQDILRTQNSVLMMTGEAMLGLWGALKSTLRANDKVLAIANGIFGAGIAEMARAIGAQVQVIDLPYDVAVGCGCGYEHEQERVQVLQRIEQAIKSFAPKMITMVHCETPSGILNSLAEVGELKRQYGVPLFCVDAVSSIGGALLDVDQWGIDLCLGGGQKAPSIFPDMTFVAVSEAAWEIIEQVNYVGYDAFKPFRYAVRDQYFPYTPHWNGVAALHGAAMHLLQEGVEQVYQRHQRAAALCCNAIDKMGLMLYPKAIAYSSPTVTAIKVPEQRISWRELDQRLRARGVLLGGSYGALAGKVFRVGHMGTQADISLIERSMQILAEVLV